MRERENKALVLAGKNEPRVGPAVTMLHVITQEEVQGEGGRREEQKQEPVVDKHERVSCRVDDRVKHGEGIKRSVY